MPNEMNVTIHEIAITLQNLRDAAQMALPAVFVSNMRKSEREKIEKRLTETITKATEILNKINQLDERKSK